MAEIRLGYLILENKSSIYWIFICLCLLSCNNKFSGNSPHATVEQEEVKLIKYLPDTTINGIFKLENYLSIKEFSINNKFEYIEKIRESPVVIFFNDNSEEYLLAYQYEGDTEYAFGCFEIGYNKDNTLSKYPHIRTKDIAFFRSIILIVKIYGGLALI
ncbi:hypothetical protein [Dysgonomonas sp.]|jgi:hypothetical protein|nr:hypothetical protein [Prevotella sp.]